MYTPVCENTVTYEDKLMHWKNYMVFQDMKPIEYLEIGSLHGGSVLQFHNIFGNDVHSTCALILMHNVITIWNIRMNMKRIMRYTNRTRHNWEQKTYTIEKLHQMFYRHYRTTSTMLYTSTAITIYVTFWRMQFCVTGN